MPLLTLSTILGSAALGAAVTAARRDLDLHWIGVAIWAAALAAAAAVFGWREDAELAGALIIAFGAPLAVIDARRMILPNPITYGLIAAALIFAILDGRAVEAALGGAVGFAALWSLSALWMKHRGVEALGLGDAKLFAGIGAALGPFALAEVAATGALATLIWSVLSAKIGGRAISGADAAPFGPGLIFGAWLVWRFGPFLA